jgi:thiamine kinase-like enzyme
MIVSGFSNPAFTSEHLASLRSLLRRAETLLDRWPEVEQLSAAMPPTLVHADLVAKNMRVRPGADGPTLVALDWETAGWGRPGIDLQSVDVEEYAREIRSVWPTLGSADIVASAHVGEIFWFVACVDWESWAFETEWVWRMDVTSTAAARRCLPDEAELAASVAHALRCDRASVTILSRVQNVHTSTWPSEIVDCRIGREREMRLLVKHGPYDVRNAHGHSVGPRYEAAVYETVLRAAGLSHPFIAARHDRGSRYSCIVLEYLGQGWWRLDRVEDPHAIVRVAAWVGSFHAGAAPRVDALAGRLNAYDATYYAGWAGRSLRYLPRLPDEFQWLQDVCHAFGPIGARLAAGPLTVVHGEFYPQNVLLHGEKIRPLDWEWAGIAAGEVDLAALTDGWSAELTEASERAYAGARWPTGPPPDFAWRLDAARVYMHLRWLADRTDRIGAPQLETRLEDLKAVGQQLGMVHDGHR